MNHGHSERGARAFRRKVGNAGHEIGDADAACAVDPDAALHSIGVAGVADDGAAAGAHVIGAAMHWRRDLLRRLAVAAVDAAVGDSVAALEAPDLSEERID